MLRASGGQIRIEAREGRKRFTMRAYSGGALHLKEFEIPVVVDLDGMTIESQSLPTPYDHDLGNVVGQTDRVTRDAAGIEASGYLDTETDDGRLVASANRGGFGWEASIGAIPLVPLERVEPGESVRVNDQTFTGPILVARKTILKEISFVRRGADVGRTHVAIAARLGTKPMSQFVEWLRAKGEKRTKFAPGLAVVLRAAYSAETGEEPDVEEEDMVMAGDGMEPEPKADPFDDWMKKKGADPATATDEIKAILRAAYDSEMTDTPKVAASLKAVKDATAEAIRAQRQVWEIEQAAKEFPEIKARAVSESGELNAGWDLGRVKQEIELQTLRASYGSGPFIAVGGHDRKCTAEALAGAMILRAGGKLDSRAYQSMAGVAIGLPSWIRAGVNEDRRQRAMEYAHQFSQYSAVDLCREALRLDGRNIPGSRDEMIRAAFSGGTLTNIFTTSVNAIIIESYQEAPSTIEGWTQPGDVPDFKTQDEIQLVKDGAGMRKLPRGGEAEHAKRSDRIESYKIDRFAEQMIVDDQDVIDDNLNAFRDFPREMGLKANRLPQDLVYGVILSNPTLGATARALFNVTDGNLGSSAALTGPNLKLGIAAMNLLQDNGVNLNFAPTHLIVPPSLRWTAAELLQSAAIVIAGTAGSVTERGSKNVLENAISTIVVDARLENGVTFPKDSTTYGGSATTWYLASNMARTIRVAYLAGTGRAPQTRNFTLDKGRYGMGWDIKFDVGAAAMDWRGLRKTTA
jgi:hypothetical protein